MSAAARLRVLVAACAALAAVAVTYTLYAAGRTDARDKVRPGGPAVVKGTFDLTGHQRILFRNMAWGPQRDHLSSVPLNGTGGTRTAAPLTCVKFHAAGGTGVCVQAKRGPVTTFSVLILDSRLRELRRYAAGGGPSRTRVSPSGRMVAWTVFVSGDSYAGVNFSTRTAIVDTRTWTLHPNMEKFTVIKDGRPYRSVDVNFWGVTFASDDLFYATMATKGKTYLVRGNVSTRTVRTLKENAECPSVSPDGTRVAFKHRVKGDMSSLPWRLHVLDLRTMKETATAEKRPLDDQVGWLDDKTLLYAIPAEYESDQYRVPADGTGAPALVMKAAQVPAVLP
ncbi:hypothetical protein ACGFNU_29265 [Spirillospora sp. NPDC048911]|uniref:hypothetical protein n=1 Tax=Spirillospora sp. NPDC048911 TaxID=3364527 RepID=UPI0037196F20